MHNLLFSGLPPIGRESGSSRSWKGFETFRRRWIALALESEQINVCIGYVSNDAIAEVGSMLRSSRTGVSFNLTLGMAHFEGLARSQIDSLKELQTYLESSNRGTINVVKSWPFHGKLSLFKLVDKRVVAIVGSSNFSGIAQGVIQYEIDIEVVDSGSVHSLNEFANELQSKASQRLDDSIRCVSQKSRALDNVIGVETLNSRELENAEMFRRKSDLVYRMPLKAGSDARRSNLNVFFGEGRANSQRSMVIPRPWYEVELQPGRDWYRTAKQFPRAQQHFSVVTDDGYRFSVYSSLDRSWNGPKNFRSTDDLQVLGRWIKGRLEAAGVLKPGEVVTEQVLAQYGCDYLEFSRLSDSEWFMSFRPEED